MKIINSLVIIFFVAFFISFETMAQWNPTNGPYGGKINCVASTGKRLLACTNSGLYYSINHGESWQIDSVGNPNDFYLKDFTISMSMIVLLL